MQAEPGHEHGAEAGEEHADMVSGHGVAYRLKAEGHGEAQENKANHLIPEGAGRFDDGRSHMLRKHPSMPDGLAARQYCYPFPHAPWYQNLQMRELTTIVRRVNCR